MRSAFALMVFLSIPASADPAARLGDLWEKGARRELLECVRAAKDAGDLNGAVPLVEALIALADGRLLETSEYARKAADAADLDFGDRERARRRLEAGGTPEAELSRIRATHELLEVLLACGEEWEWRDKGDRARAAWTAAAELAGKLLDRSLSVDEALFLANIRYRAHHRLAGLALRSGNESEFQSQAALAQEAHAARTALAAAPSPASREEWERLVESGPMSCVRERPVPPDDAVKALREAPKMFSGTTPAALLLAALDDRFGDRALPLRWDAALALAPNAKDIAPSIRKWLKATDRPSVGRALLFRAGESIEAPEADLDDPWVARSCSDENALERAFERQPKAKRVAVAFRLGDLRREDEIDLGR